MRLTVFASMLCLSCAAVACSPPAEVETESRRQTPTIAPDDSTSGGETTTTTTTTTVPGSAEPPPSVRFVLDDVIVEVAMLATTAPIPPGGSDGFLSAVEAEDGRLVAAGFDGIGDVIGGEPAALWVSTDGLAWERTASELSDEEGLQDLGSLVATDSGVEAFGNVVDVSQPPPQIVSANRWTADAGLEAWASSPGRPATSVRHAQRVDDGVLLAGADQWNTPGGFLGLVEVVISDGSTRLAYTDVDGGGQPIPGSEVNDVAIDSESGEWLAVGATTITDPDQDGDELAVDIETTGFASDVGLWRSDDAGASWSPLAIDLFNARTGAQSGVDVLRTNEAWWLLTREQGIGANFEHRLYTSPDGLAWSVVDTTRPTPPSGSELAASRGLYVFDGIVVVVDELVNGADPSLLMTMIDPSTGATDQHDLTAELGGIHGIEDVIELADGSAGLGFGRVERGINASDLQVIDIRQTDESPEPEPEPEEPAPTTTAPATGGGSSNA